MKYIKTYEEITNNAVANPLGQLTQLKDNVPNLLQKIINFAKEHPHLLIKGDKTLDKLQIFEDSRAQVVVSNLIATQNVVYIGKTTEICIKGSRGDRFDAPLYEGAKNGYYSNFNIWVAGEDTPTHIIDGHHRWSALTMLNPNTKVSGMIWVKTDPVSALAYLTAALRSLGMPGQGKSAPKGNATPIKGHCTPQIIKNELIRSSKTIEPNDVDNTYNTFVRKYKEDFNVQENVLQVLSKNLSICANKIPDNAPKRELMPQLGFTKEEPNIGKKVVSGLKLGVIDIKPPFVKV